MLKKDIKNKKVNQEIMNKPNIVEIYGEDHSPWVQSVLLGMYDNNIHYNLRAVPTIGLLSKSGMMMPAMRIGRSEWKLDSMEILQTLGYDSVSSLEKKMIFKTWNGVTHRIDNPFKFFYSWSLCRGFFKNKLLNLFNHLLRPFTTIYFFTLLSLVSIKMRKFIIKEDFLDQYAYWDKRLINSDNKFFGGVSPNIIDYQLFGIIQSHCSIPYIPLIKTLQESSKLQSLRKWISNMHVRFADYPHLYSADYFNPKQKIVQNASLIERALYWLGLVALLIMLPFTIMFLLFLLIRRK